MIIHSVKEMEELGLRIGQTLQLGDVLLLQGELGAGKTALTRGIGLALGFTDITSPTFVIAKIYTGPKPLVHVDAYRLQGQPFGSFDDLDLESRIPQSITVIEWGEGFIERLDANYATVTITHGASENERIVEISGLEL